MPEREPIDTSPESLESIIGPTLLDPPDPKIPIPEPAKIDPLTDPANVDVGTSIQPDGTQVIPPAPREPPPPGEFKPKVKRIEGGGIV